MAQQGPKVQLLWSPLNPRPLPALILAPGGHMRPGRSDNTIGV